MTLLFEDKQTLEDIGVMDRQALIVTEVLTDEAKQLVEQHYFSQERALEEEQKLQDLDQDAHEKDTSLLRASINYTQSNPKFFNSSAISTGGIIPEDLFLKPASEAQSQETGSERTMIDTTETTKVWRQDKKISMHQFFNIYYKNKVSPVELLPHYQPPQEVVIMVFNRKLCLRDANESLLKKYEPVLFGTQFPILATKNTSRRELYEQVWMRVRSMLKHTCYDRQNLWWNRTEKLPNAA